MYDNQLEIMEVQECGIRTSGLSVRHLDNQVLRHLIQIGRRYAIRFSPPEIAL
jgi:hypothetical protein